MGGLRVIGAQLLYHRCNQRELLRNGVRIQQFLLSFEYNPSWKQLTNVTSSKPSHPRSSAAQVCGIRARLNMSRQNALQQLKCVHSIVILHRNVDATTFYQVEVTPSSPRRHSPSRIPTVRASCGAFSNNDSNDLPLPAIRIERELHEFIALRDNVYNTVRWAHRDHHCEFCAKLADLLVFGPNPDGMFLSLFGGKRASSTLQNFISGILLLIVEFSSSTNQQNCAGMRLVPEIVYSFLFDSAPVTV